MNKILCEPNNEHLYEVVYEVVHELSSSINGTDSELQKKKK